MEVNSTAVVYASRSLRSSFTRAIVLVIVVLSFLLALNFSLSQRSIRMQQDRIRFSSDPSVNHFQLYQGHQDCGIASTEIYEPPDPSFSYCKNRATLLEAMTGGGRHGFDAPFFPSGCHYRWYNTAEICMILERFGAVIFLGDDMVRTIYSAFNVLLRENVALGGLKQWEMTESERSFCRCDNQFTREECTRFAITGSDDMRKYDGTNGNASPYSCSRTRHAYFPISGSPAPQELHNSFRAFVRSLPPSYKPVPVIYSLALGAYLNYETSTSSMEEFLDVSSTIDRNLPFLWLGPAAAGHLKPPGLILGQGNNALWHFNVIIGKEAMNRDMEVLGMYNVTLQARSWDGTGYGEEVALVQAMMTRNILIIGKSPDIDKKLIA